MFSDHDEMSPSIAAVSAAPTVACSMLAVQQQKLKALSPIRRRVRGTTSTVNSEGQRSCGDAVELPLAQYDSCRGFEYIL